MAPKTQITTPHLSAVTFTHSDLSLDETPFKQSTKNEHQVSAESPAIQSRWLPVKKMASCYQDVITEQALRALIWSAEAYQKSPKSGLKSNGFLPVIVRPPNQRKVLLDRVEFEKWLTSRQRTDRN